jgi:hypothetical protein
LAMSKVSSGLKTAAPDEYPYQGAHTRSLLLFKANIINKLISLSI